MKLMSMSMGILLLLAPALAQAQMNSQGADMVFEVNNNEVMRLTQTGLMDVSGTLKLKSSTATCSGTVEGVLRYNSTTKVAELCDGTDWKALNFQ